MLFFSFSSTCVSLVLLFGNYVTGHIREQEYLDFFRSLRSSNVLFFCLFCYSFVWKMYWFCLRWNSIRKLKTRFFWCNHHACRNTFPEQMTDDREPYYLLCLPTSQSSSATVSGSGIARNDQNYSNNSGKKNHRKAQKAFPYDIRKFIFHFARLSYSGSHWSYYSSSLWCCAWDFRLAQICWKLFLASWMYQDKWVPGLHAVETPVLPSQTPSLCKYRQYLLQKIYNLTKFVFIVLSIVLPIDTIADMAIY